MRRTLISLIALVGCGGTDDAPPPPTPDATGDSTAVAPDAGPTGNGLPPLAKGSDTDPLSRTATLPLAGVQASPGALAVAGNGLLAYCDGMKVAIATDELTPPATPASNTLPGDCLAVVMDGELGFASARGAGWHSVAAEGIVLPHVIEGPDARALALTNERVYAAAGTQGLASALRGGESATVHGVAKDARDVLVHGADLIVADGRSGILRVALAPDGTPSIKASIAPADVDWAVAPLDDTHVLAARGAAGVALLDTTGDGLTVTATFDTTGLATDVAAGPDGLAMVADWGAARLVDLSKPDAPALVAREAFQPTKTAQGRALGIAYAGGAFHVLGVDHLTRLVASPAVVAAELEVLRNQIFVEALPCDAADPTCEELNSAGVLFRNRGRKTLEVTKLAVSDPRVTLHVDPSPVAGVDLVITTDDPAGFFELQVQGAAPLDAVLSFETNDPDNATVTVPIRVNPPLVKVGDPGPDFLFPGLDGAGYQLSALGGKVIYMKIFNSL